MRKEIWPGVYEYLAPNSTMRCRHQVDFPSTVTGMVFNYEGVVALNNRLKLWIKEHKNCEEKNR